MTTAYTSLLGLALPVTGELSGTWGDTVNNSITSLLDSAISGTTTISADADITLTTTTGAANESREAIILWTAGGTVTRNITAPAQSKTYIVINKSSSTQSIVLRGVGPTTGVTIIKGESAVCAWNGSDFIKISNISGAGTFTDLTVTGNTSLGDADTDTITQAASYVTGTQLKSAKTATNTLALAAYDVDGTAYTNLVTLTASNTPTLTLTSTGVGSIDNMTVGATTASTGAFTTFSASGTATFSGNVSMTSSSFTRTATTQAWLDGSMTTAAWTVGGTTQTGTITLGRSTGAQTLNIATGATTASTTKAINIGTAGVSTSVTNITSGSSVAGALVTHTWNAGANNMTLDSSGNVGIGNTAANVNDQVGAVRPLLVSKADTATTIAGSQAVIVIGNSDTTTSNTSQLSFAAITGANATYYTSAAINCIFGARTNGQYPTGILTFSTSTTLNSAPTEKMRIDTSGNVGVGTSSPGYKLDVNGDVNVVADSSYFIGANADRYIKYRSSQNDVLYSGYAGLFYQQGIASTYHAWFTGNNERMRIDSSGNVGIGTTAPSSATNTNSVAIIPGSGQILHQHLNGTASGSVYSYFIYNGSAIASISQNGTTAVAYNTSSDYRLKENIAPITGALSKVAALKPVTYTWKSAPDEVGEGFIAHELAEVCPQAVHGTKDAVDADGKPVYQGIDTSFLVATLTAAIQEQQALITSLTARIAALEST